MCDPVACKLGDDAEADRRRSFQVVTRCESLQGPTGASETQLTMDRWVV